jgi:hypothetical protein
MLELHTYRSGSDRANVWPWKETIRPIDGARTAPEWHAPEIVILSSWIETTIDDKFAELANQPGVSIIAIGGLAMIDTNEGPWYAVQVIVQRRIMLPEESHD